MHSSFRLYCVPACQQAGMPIAQVRNTTILAKIWVIYYLETLFDAIKPKGDDDVFCFVWAEEGALNFNIVFIVD